MQSPVAGPRVVVALDYANAEAAELLVEQLDPGLCRLKLGNELFTHAGPTLIERWQARGFEIFLDLKYHDIPNTVAAACRAAAKFGVWMVNVHALGGRRMLEAAQHALVPFEHRPMLMGVTVLTSLERRDLAEIGIDADPARLASRLAVLAQDCGCDGVVCSAREAAAMRAAHGRDFRLVTPGIRPVDSRTDDQRRTLTPGEAVAAGADYLVVGRPVTIANDPIAALNDLTRQIERTA
jgi:orotidine-5'-phosphate decarboxylase